MRQVLPFHTVSVLPLVSTHRDGVAQARPLTDSLREAKPVVGGLTSFHAPVVAHAEASTARAATTTSAPAGTRPPTRPASPRTRVVPPISFVPPSNVGP